MKVYPAVSEWFCIVVDKKWASARGFRLYEVAENHAFPWRRCLNFSANCSIFVVRDHKFMEGGISAGEQ